MPVYYPAFLSIEGRPCLVVGGGQIAERKVKGLLDAGARVTLVSPTVTPRLQRRIDKGQVEYFDREFQSSDFDGMYLLITATDDMPLNREIGIEGRKLGLVVNVVDDPDYCDFIAPSIVRRGEITFAISTAGASPALARWLRHQIEEQFPPSYAGLARVMAKVRIQVRGGGHTVSAARWQKSIDESFLSLVKQRRLAEARRHLFAALTGGRSAAR